jgi:hypothetical protein
VICQTDPTIQPFNNPTNKKPSFHKTRNEGIQRIQTKTVRLAGLILLFAEKLLLAQRRAQSNRYPDFKRGLVPAFPPRGSGVGKL